MPANLAQTPSSRGKLIDRVREILPEIEARTREAEELRRMPPETMATLKHIGFMQGLVPLERGGGQEDIFEWLQAVRLLSSVCMSTGWTAAVLGIHAHGITAFDKRVQDEVWADGPDTLVSTSGAPVGKAVRVPGGITLSGRFHFSSGSDYASWALLGFFFDEDRAGGRGRFHAALPRKDYRIEDVWYASGLKGTGSNDIVVEDVFVPDYRIRNSALDAPNLARGLYADPFYDLPFHSIWSVMFAAVVLGGAEGALRSWQERLKTKVKAAMGLAMVNHVPTQQRLSESTLDIEAAASVLEGNWRELSRRGKAHEGVSLAEMRKMRAQDAHATRLCLTAVDRVAMNAGGSLYYSNQGLQRFRRDLHMTSQHNYLDSDSAYELFARDLLGLDRDITKPFS